MPSYTPEFGDVGWEPIRAFVEDVVDEVGAKVPYSPAFLSHAVAHHVHWCVNVASLPQRRDAVFRRDVIGASVYAMPTANTSSQGRRRSALLRVGEALGVIAASVPLPPLSPASPSAPYSDLEVALVRQWVSMQREKDARSAAALVALGLGAGLAAHDLASVRGKDVSADGEAIYLPTRVVPVLPAWQGPLWRLAAGGEGSDAALFRPGTKWSKNVVTVFVGRSVAVGLRPSTQRMRATWLLLHLAVGTPMQDLLSAAGLASMDALVRYERFLPPPAPAAHAGMRQ